VPFAISLTGFRYGPGKCIFLMSLKGFIFSLLIRFTNKPWEIHRRSTILIVLLETFEADAAINGVTPLKPLTEFNPYYIFWLRNVFSNLNFFETLYPLNRNTFLALKQ